MNKKITLTAILFIALLLIIYLTRKKIVNINSDNDIIILTYHHILSAEEKEKYQKDNNYTVTSEEFEEQLKFLKENNYNSINSSELKCWLKNLCELPDKSVLITLDDGNMSSYKYALPILEKYEFNAIFFVITSRVKEISEEWDPSKLQFMGLDLIHDINENHSLVELGSHSHDLHKTINNISPKDYYSKEDLKKDIMFSKEILNTDLFCYPFGQYNEKYIDALKESGYEMAFTFKPFKKVSKEDDFFEVSRINVNADISIKKFKKLLK